MQATPPRQFLLERWFAEFEFIPGIRNLAGSGSEAPNATELLALEGPDAVQRYLDRRLDYIENPGGEPLRAAIAALHPGISPAEVRVTTGASEAILLLLWTQLQPGDNLVVADPCYQSHGEVAVALGAEVRRLPLRAEDGWKPDPERLAALLDRRTRLVLLNYPHNPTGAALTGGELEALIRVCEAAGATFVSDEVFRPIALDGTPMPSVTSISERAVALGDLSKPWGLGGLRVGWVAGHEAALLRQVSEARDYTTMCGSGPAEMLAEIALRHSARLLAPRLETARANRRALAALITESAGRLRWQQPTAGYSAWVGLPPGVEAEQFCRQLAQKQGVLLLPGSVFGADYAGYLRIGIGGDPETFTAGLAILRERLATGQG